MSESVAVFRERLESSPMDVNAFEDYERELVRIQDIDSLSALYFSSEGVLGEKISNYWMRLLRHVDQAVSREEDPERRGHLFLMIGRIYEEKMGRTDQANASYQQAYRVWPRLSEALDRARAIYSAAGNWDLVLRLWEMQGRNDREPAAQADIFVAMGRVCLDHISDGARATDYARRALTQVPGHAGAQKILDDYADLIRDWRGEVAVMASEARDLETTEAQVEALQEVLLFVTDRVPLEQAEGGDIARELTELDPQNIRSWVLARNWFDRDGAAEDAEAAHRPLVDLLEGSDRIEALREAARRAHDLSLVPQEIAARRGLLLDLPSDPQNFQELEALADREESQPLLLEIYEDALEVGAGEPVDILRKAAHLAQQLERFDAAEKHFLALRELEPEALDALEFLSDRVRERGDSETLFELLTAWAPLRSAEDAAPCWEEAAVLAEHQLQQPATAIEAWLEHRRLRPESEAARVALRRLYRNTQAPTELAALLEQELRADEPIDSPMALLDELSDLYTDELEQHDQALAHLTTRVGLDTSDAVAGARLREVARRAGDLDRVREDLLMRVENAPMSQRFEYVDALARLELELDRPDAARPWLDELMGNDETGIDLLEARRDMAQKEGDTEALLSFQHRIATRLEGDAEAGTQALLLLAGFAEQAKAYDVAVNAYQSVLRREGDEHIAARRGVIRGLDASERWEELAEYLELDLRFEPTADTHERLADIAETKLEDAERASEHRNQAIRLDPTHDAAAAALFRHYALEQQWAEIERVADETSKWEDGWDHMFGAWKPATEALDAGTYPDTELPAVYVRLRRIAQDILADNERRYQAADWHARQQDDASAWEEAADRAHDAEHVKEEFLAIVRAATLSSDKDEAARRWTRAAELAEADEQHGTDGWQERANAWKATPSVRLLRDNLAKSSIKTLRIEEYAELLDAHLPDVDEDTQAMFLRDLGALFNGPLENEERGRGYWAQLLGLRPEDPDALEALHQLYTPEHFASELSGVVETLLKLSTDDEERRDLEVERAELLDYFLEDAEGALSAWRVVKARGGERTSEADERIEALLRFREDWPALEQFFSEQLGMAASPEAAGDAMARRGVLRLREMAQEPAGVQDLLNVLSGFADSPAAAEADQVLREHVVGDHAQVVDALMEWHEAYGRSDVADALLEERVNAHGDDEPARCRQLIERLKPQAARQLDAIEHWMNLQFAHAPERDEAREMMRWSRQTETSSELVSAWTERLIHVDEVPLWWPEYLNLAVETHSDTDRVLEVLRRLRGLDETQTEAISDAIEELLASVGRIQEQIDVIVARAETESGEMAAARYETAGQLAEFELEDYDQASALYRKAVEEEPESERLIPDLVRNLLAAEQWTEVVAQLRETMERFPDSSEKPQWHAQLARASSRAGEPDETVFEELRHAASLMPSAPAVGEGLTHLAFSEGIDPEIARSAASLYLSLGVREADLRRELHERIVALTPDAERRLPSLLALGEILRADAEYQRRAWDVYAQALELQPTRGQTAKALESLAAELGEWRATAELFAGYGRDLGTSGGIELLERSVRIEVEETQDLESAARHLETILELEGENDVRLSTLEGWYDTLQTDDRVLAVIDRRAALAKEEGNEGHFRAMRLLGVQVADSRIQKHEDTVRRWREIVDEDPAAQLQGLQELSRLHRAETEWTELDSVLSERIGLREDEDARHALLREQAALREEELKDPAGAIESLSRIVSENLEEVDALYELDRLYLSTEDHEARYHCIQERFGRSGRVEDRLELARAGLKLEDARESSLATLSSLVLSDLDVRLDALDTLRDVADNQPEWVDVDLWMVLAQVFEDEGDLAAAARANIAVAEALPTRSVARERLWLAVQQRLTAFDALEDAAEMAVALWEEEACPQARVELVKDTVRRAQKESLYAETAERHLESTPAEWLRRDLIAWYADDQPSVERRRVHLQKLFELYPNDISLYQNLLAVTPAEEQVPVLRTRMNATTDENERQRLRQSLGLALAKSEAEEDKKEAQDLLEAFRQTQSANEEVNQTLRQLLADSGQWWQLASLIEEELWLTDNSEARARLLVERARCREKEEALPSMLVEGWFDVLVEDVSQPDAIVALTEMTDSLDDPILIARVQDRLELAYERGGRWRELYDLLLQRSAQAELRDRVDALSRAAAIADTHLHDDNLAFNTYRMLIGADPSDPAAVSRAYELAVELEETGALRIALEEGLETAGLDPALRASLRRRSALLKATEPGRHEEAIAELSQLFDASKEWDIVDDVRRLYGDDRDALTQWLESRADAVDDLDTRIRLLHQASETLSGLEGREEQAGAILEAIFLLQPSVKGAEELDQLYARAGLHKPRVIFWSARLQDETPLMELSELHKRLHKTLVADEALWAEQIKHLNTWWDAMAPLREAWGDEAKAEREEKIWRAQLDDTIERWCNTYDPAEREGDMLDALMKRVDSVSKADMLFRARVAVASSEERADRLWEDLVNQRAETVSLQNAWDTASEALRDAPERGARGANIERLAAELGNYEEAAALLRHITQKNFEERYELAVRAARIDIDKLQLLERATTTLQRVLEVKPDHAEARAMLRGVLDVATRRELRQRVMDTLIETAIEPAEKASLAMIGTLRADEREDLRAATAGARRALEFDPGHAGVRNFLLERRDDPRWRDVLVQDLLPVLRAEMAVAELQQLIEALAESETQAVLKGQYAAELAGLLAGDASSSAGALSAWLDALKSHPHSPSYLENAVAAVATEEDAVLLRDTLSGLVETTQAPEVHAALYAAIGRVELEILGDAKQGEASLLRAIQANPRNENALAGLETYYLDSANYEGLATLLEARMAATVEPKQRRVLADRVITLLRGELQRPNDAAKILEEMVQADGHDESLFEALRASYREAGNTLGEVRTLERLAARATDVDERIDLRTEALELAKDDPSLADRALTLADALLLDDNQHSSALVVRERLLRARGDRKEALAAQLALIHLHADDDAAAIAVRHALATPTDNAREDGRAIARILTLAMERGLFQDQHVLASAAWLPHIAIAEQRRVIQHVLEQDESPARCMFLVSALQSLRPSTDEQLGGEVAAALRAEGELSLEENTALAQWFESSNQYPEAIVVLHRIVEQTEAPERKSELLLRIAQLEERRENFGVLMGLYEQARAFGNESSMLYEALGRGYEREERWVELLDLLEKRAENAQGEERVRLLRRIAAVQRARFGNLVEAQAVLETAVAEGGDLTIQVELLEVLVDLQNQPAANALIIALNGKDLRRELRHRVELCAGLLALQAGRWEDARGWLESARSHAASHARTLLNLAQANIGLQQWGDAQEALQAALVNQDQLNSEEKATTFVLLARVQAQDGSVERARELVTRALRLVPTLATALELQEELDRLM